MKETNPEVELAKCAHADLGSSEYVLTVPHTHTLCSAILMGDFKLTSLISTVWSNPEPNKIHNFYIPVLDFSNIINHNFSQMYFLKFNGFMYVCKPLSNCIQVPHGDSRSNMYALTVRSPPAELLMLKVVSHGAHSLSV